MIRVFVHAGSLPAHGGQPRVSVVWLRHPGLSFAMDRSQRTGSACRRQRLREADLMPVRIVDVKESLTPGSVAWLIRLQPSFDQYSMIVIGICDAENRSAPPLRLVRRVRCQIHECLAKPKAAEGGLVSTVYKLEAKLFIERYRLRHVTHGKSNSADVRDGHVSSSTFVGRQSTPIDLPPNVVPPSMLVRPPFLR